MNIAMKLVSKEDAEECVNDTFLAVWNQIPPNKPILYAHIFLELQKSCPEKISH